MVKSVWFQGTGLLARLVCVIGGAPIYFVGQYDGEVESEVSAGATSWFNASSSLTSSDD